MEPIKKVALVGASGRVGSAILQALLSDGTFQITILVRSSTTLAKFHQATIVNVEFENEESLREALKGHDVLISALGKLKPGVEERLIDAAVGVNVRRIIPSGFGCDLENEKCRQFPTYKTKVGIEEKLKQLASEGKTTYTFIYNNVLLDWGIDDGFLIDTKYHKITLFDDGDAPFSATRIPTVARAVVGIIHATESTSNRAVRVQEVVITQNALLTAARAKAPSTKWDITTVSTKQLEHNASKEILSGKQLTPELFYSFAARAAFGEGYGGRFVEDDNELLGIAKVQPIKIPDIFK